MRDKYFAHKHHIIMKKSATAAINNVQALSRDDGKNAHGGRGGLNCLSFVLRWSDDKSFIIYIRYI